MSRVVAIGIAAIVCVFLADSEAADTPPKLRTGKFTLSDADRAYWAFQPIARPVAPVIEEAWAINPVDAFLLERLRERGLRMNPQATPRELVRRAFFDVLGLPPSPDDVAGFERMHSTNPLLRKADTPARLRPANDSDLGGMSDTNPSSDRAWSDLIDRLLASPQFGERWARHWLDLVRYAESNGYERDGPKPHAWRYRDYVIDAFNSDKPYDQFIREQLAGDELAEDLFRSHRNSDAWREAIIATGFYRLHVWDDEPDSTVAAEYDDLDDILGTTTTAFLGLTVNCARCHDHKYDPISQSDYYAMLGFFRSIDPYGLHKTGGGGRGTGKIERPLATAPQLRAWHAEREARVRELEAQRTASSDPETRKSIETRIKQARAEKPPFDSALAVAENGPTPIVTQLLHRGDPFSPRDEVRPAFPAVFNPDAPAFPVRPPDAPTTGRRRILADWIASPRNPLTARVIVNRIWQHYFGTGLVPTPDDFGQTGVPPNNQPLLDYLASELVEGGWRIKRIHRLILTSRAYRMSSRADNPAGLARDESNHFLWRQSLRRLEAEAIRDTMLAVAGTLNLERGGPSVYPTLPPEVHRTQDSSGKGWTDSPLEAQRRRSIYLVVKRALKVPLLECLDFANSASPVGARPVTTTAPQALMLLNDDFIQRQGAALADRVEHGSDSDWEARIRRAFAFVLQRPPAESELTSARAFLGDQERRAAAEGKPNAPRIALESFCRALLNLNELIYID